MAEGLHHIDGMSIDNQKPKLIVKGCKFSSSLNYAFNLQRKNTKFLLFDKKLQVLESSKSSDSESSSLISWKLIIPGVMTVFVAFIVFIIIKKTRTNSSDTSDDDNVSFQIAEDLI